MNTINAQILKSWCLCRDKNDAFELKTYNSPTNRHAEHATVEFSGNIYKVRNNGKGVVSVNHDRNHASRFFSGIKSFFMRIDSSEADMNRLMAILNNKSVVAGIQSSDSNYIDRLEKWVNEQEGETVQRTLVKRQIVKLMEEKGSTLDLSHKEDSKDTYKGYIESHRLDGHHEYIESMVSKESNESAFFSTLTAIPPLPSCVTKLNISGLNKLRGSADPLNSVEVFENGTNISQSDLLKRFRFNTKRYHPNNANPFVKGLFCP
ncbi:hypothetical protein EO087_03580 [Dyella sp. M7H15-1]|uniref:hypothetical protein n=1 Tax=Dyella sp. M7H15-1 TaxID=2501295 RepID=UPI001004F0BF|nr:hypothetical protein [Dyella sp. M7H15-1]QAU23185.1 hypothetical protein EO087_03580 [Dyella sp. M7H15-1]